MHSTRSEEEKPLAPGLYVVATPIGNLEDITFRALRILKQADLIACEDTRQTQKLLNHYGISTRTISYHEHNEAGRAAELVEQLGKGAQIALVSDAGMPGISDPGFRLVNLCIEHGIPVTPIPGASALLLALAASGMATDEFRFHGFLPPKPGQRSKMLAEIRDSSFTEIFYEAPHRLKETLADVVQALGPARPICIARELTKIHEEFLRGRASELLQTLNSRDEIKGEITLLIGKSEESGTQAENSLSIRERVTQILAEEGGDEKSALKKIAKERNISKSEAYRQLQRSS